MSIPLICLCMSSEIGIASSVEGECGGVIFEVQVIEDPSESESLYTLYYKINDKEKKLLYTPVSEHLSLACVQDQRNRNFLLLEEMCGGSGCSDEGTYTLIDPNTKKALVKYTPMPLHHSSGDKYEYLVRLAEYEKKNHEQIAKIIGYAPPYLPQSTDKYVMQINCSASATLAHIAIETYGAAKQI